MRRELRAHLAILLSTAILTACSHSDDHVDRMSREHEGDHPAASRAAQETPGGDVEKACGIAHRTTHHVLADQAMHPLTGRKNKS